MDQRDVELCRSEHPIRKHRGRAGSRANTSQWPDTQRLNCLRAHHDDASRRCGCTVDVLKEPQSCRRISVIRERGWQVQSLGYSGRGRQEMVSTTGHSPSGISQLMTCELGKTKTSFRSRAISTLVSSPPSSCTTTFQPFSILREPILSGVSISGRRLSKEEHGSNEEPAVTFPSNSQCSTTGMPR